nr:unnamed protein product [Callosobruchus analis]
MKVFIFYCTVNHTVRSNCLKKTAVPSQKLPVSTVGSPKCAGVSSDRTDRYKRREIVISEKHLDSAFLQNRKVRDTEVQVNIDRINTLSNLLKTNAALKSFTGINTFQILDYVVKLIKEFSHECISKDPIRN